MAGRPVGPPADEHVRAGRNRVAERIRDWYQQGEAEASGWEVRWEQVPQQENDEDCGVAVLMAMRRRVLVRRRPRKVADWGYAGGELGQARWKIAQELRDDRVIRYMARAGETRVRSVMKYDETG